MEIAVAEQGLFLLPVKVTHDQAREKAWEQKLNIFGTLSKFLMRPKGEEIQVSLLELRYQPFWHAASHKHFRYDRRTQYHVPVVLDVQAVEIAGQTYTPAGGRLTLHAVDHCLLEERHEVFLDGLTGEFKPTGRAFGDQLKKVLSREVLFDIGAETMNLVVPGGAIAVKLTKAVMDRRQAKRP